MKNSKAWSWVPSLYFMEGLPYALVVHITPILYKKLNISNADLAFYTSWLYFPWVIKPLWSPFVDLLKNKRWWIVAMQFLLGVCMAGVAFTITTDFFFQATMVFFWLLAFSSATHDIAADGFYMLALDKGKQSFFVGIRNTAYRLAMIFGQGVLVILVGYIEVETGNIPFSWSVAFFVSAVILVVGALFHKLILPRPDSDIKESKQSFDSLGKGFWDAIIDFFSKKGILVALFFLLTYRLAESQLLKLTNPFFLDDRVAGGLELSTQKVGYIYGTLGPLALISGGILGGFAISKDGLKKWLWPMAFAISIPNLAYLYLAYFQPDNISLIGFCVFVEQFGYGFGMTTLTMYLMAFSEGKYKTSHYAFCTGLMAAGMMIPGMAAGWIQEQIGYPHFFLWVMICTIPGFIAVRLIDKRLDS